MQKKYPGFIVAIDGPAGAGKSTVSRKLAEALNGHLLDTGAMYRAVAYTALVSGAEDEQAFSKIAEKLQFDMDPSSGNVLVNGEDLGMRLRSEKVSGMASSVSQFKGVRNVLTKRQRSLAKKWSKKIPIVVEGRDIGTVVFPKVRFKFFVTADAEVRAKRRYNELKKRGGKVSLKDILKKAQSRDKQDSTRRLAPLKCPKDAVVVDTSHMSINQVVQFMKNHIESRNFPEG